MSLERITAILDRTPMVLRDLTAGLEAKLVEADYGEGTFSTYDVVAHLVHGEHVDWMPRLRIILAEGESRPFDPFVIEERQDLARGKTLHELLDELESMRRKNLEDLRALNLTEAQLALRGTHPASGTVTASQLLSTWAVHDLHHIAQICKALAYQFRNDIGGWKRYVGIIAQAEAATAQ